MIRNGDHGPLLVSLRGSRVALGHGEAVHVLVFSVEEEKPATKEMIHEFLKVIQDGEVQNMLEISRSLRISHAMALQMADELTRRGYLQKLGADCGTPQAGRSDCPAGSNCQVLTRHWFLTDKGKVTVSEWVKKR